jgi:hypothetical protein
MDSMERRKPLIFARSLKVGDEVSTILDAMMKQAKECVSISLRRLGLSFWIRDNKNLSNSAIACYAVSS